MDLSDLRMLAIALMLLYLSACSPLRAQPSVRNVAGKEFTPATLDSIFAAAVAEAGVPGLSVAIVNGDRTVYHGVFGVTDRGNGTPVDDSTLFEAASLSKPVFAYFALKEVEAGLLDLDTPLYRYLPHPGIVARDREAARGITARMVLAHRTGFPNHARGDSISLAYPPGEGFEYSGEAYQYLAAVIAKLKGTNMQGGLDSCFQRVVGAPLGWSRSTFVGNPALAVRKATGHDEEGIPTQADTKSNFFAYSSLHSEATEYAAFLRALLRREGLAPGTFAEMLSEQSAFPEDHPLRQEVGQTGWGLGMTRKPTPYGTMHLHTGNNHDFQAYMMVLPERDFGIAFFLNGPRAVPFIQAVSRSLGPIF